MLYSRSTFTLRLFIVWITIFSVLFGSQGAVATRAAADVPLTLFVNAAFQDGQQAYWKFDDFKFNPGDLLPASRDSSGFGHTATLVSAGVNTDKPAAITRFDPQSLSLPLVSDHVEVADSPGLNNLVLNFTVAAWIKRSVTGVAATIYDSGTATNHWYVGFLSNNKLTFTEDSLADFQSSHVVTDANWHHVAFVKSSNNVTVYLDGVASSALNVGAVTTPSGVKLIGNKQTKTTGFRGNIDELRLYTRALSSAEITRLSAGKGCVTDGLAWGTAFPDLQCALDEAASGDSIWVANGEYSPGTAPEAAFAGKNGVKVYGGFAGTETQLTQRTPFLLPDVLDPSDPYTVLTGDVDGNDNLTTFAGYADNNRFVVSNLAVNSSAGWDSFIIRSGSSNFVNNAPNLPAPEPAPGGGMFNFNSSVALENLAFIANKGTRTNYGGGLTNVNSNISLRFSTFIGNLGYAGGMYTKGLTPDLREVIFKGNAGAGMGGGLGVDNGGLSIEYSNFDSNSSLADGGGLSSKKGTIDVYYTEFTGNNTLLGGGAVFITDTVAMLTKVDLIGNFSNPGTGGGGLKAVKSTLTWDLGTVEGNRTESSTGGGLMIDGGVTKLGRLKVLANTDKTATASAMDIFNTSSFTVTNSLFVGNAPQLSQTGNAIRVTSSISKFINVTFANNAKLNNPAANSADISADNLFKLGSSTQLVLSNCILWDHKLSPIDIGPGNILSTNSSIEGRSGSGTDPRFISNPNPGDGDWNTTIDNQYGDLRLLGDSPAIDRGNKNFLPAGISSDLDFKPRFFDVPFVPNFNFPTPPIDAGAYEAQFKAQVFLPRIAK